MTEYTADSLKKVCELDAKIEHLEERLNDAIDANRTFRLRCEAQRKTIAELSRLAQDAKAAPLTLDSLREAWEAAEVPTEDTPIREGDVLIRLDDDAAFDVFATQTGYHPAVGDTRVLHRAPQPEPWQDLADVMRQWDADLETGHSADSMARWFYERGVRVTGGDES